MKCLLKKVRGPYKKNKKPWEDDEDKNDPKSDIEVLSSDSSEGEVRYRVVFSPKKSQNSPKKPKKSPKKLTSHSRLEFSWKTNLRDPLESIGGLKLELVVNTVLPKKVPSQLIFCGLLFYKQIFGRELFWKHGMYCSRVFLGSKKQKSKKAKKQNHPSTKCC